MAKFSWDDQPDAVQMPQAKTGKFNWDDQPDVKAKGPKESESGIRGALSGLTAGLDDEITGGLGAVGRVFGAKNLGSWKPFDPDSKLETTNEPLSVDEIVKSYRDNRDAIRDEQKMDMEVNPKSTIAGNLVGAIVSPVSKVGMAKNVDSLNKAQKIAAAAKMGAAQGAIYSAGTSDSDLTKGEIGQFAKDTAFGAATGAAVPVALEGVKVAAQKGAQATGWASKKMFTSLFGVSEQNAKKYLARRNEINSAPELLNIKDQVDDAVSTLARDVDSGKIKVDQAKEALNELKSQVRNNLTDAKVDAREALRRTEDLFKESAAKALQPLKDKRAPTELANEVVNSIESLKSNMINKSGEAYKVLDDAFPGIVPLKNFFNKGQNLIDDLKKEATPEALSMADKLESYLANVDDMVNGGASKVAKMDAPTKAIQGNDKSLLSFLRSKGGINKVGQSNDILETDAKNLFRKSGMEADRAVEAAQESGYLLPDEGINELLEKVRKEIAGQKQFTIGKNSESLIGDYVNKLEASAKLELPKRVSDIMAPEAKKLIQGLDKVSKYDFNATSFDKGLSKYYKQLRGTLDDDLKSSVPGYSKAMEPVARDASLLNELSSFGDERGAIGKLGQIASPKGRLDRESLAKLEQATGKPGAFTKQIDEYSRAQSILKDNAKIEAIKRSLPEYQAYRQAMTKLAKMKPNWSRDQLERALSNSKEARAMSLAEDAFKKAQSRFAPVSKLSRDSTQSKLESFTKPKGAPVETRRALEELEKLTGKKFTQSLDDRAVLDSFQKAYTNGSRNTVLWTVMGTVFGGLPGAGLGASYGQLVDRYGPRMGKAILDGISNIKANPSVKAIRGLNLPENVKREIEKEFRVYINLKNSNEFQPLNKVAEQEFSGNREPALKGEALWISRGLNKLGISDSSKIKNSKEGKRLLIEASDLPEGSKRLQTIKNQLQELEK